MGIYSYANFIILLILLSFVWDFYEINCIVIRKPKSINIVFKSLHKNSMAKNICEQNINIFFNKFSML